MKKPRNYGKILKALCKEFEDADYEILSTKYVRQFKRYNKTYYRFMTVGKEKETGEIRVFLDDVYNDAYHKDIEYSVNEDSVLDLKDINSLKELNVEALEILYGKA